MIRIKTSSHLITRLLIQIFFRPQLSHEGPFYYHQHACDWESAYPEYTWCLTRKYLVGVSIIVNNVTITCNTMMHCTDTCTCIVWCILFTTLTTNTPYLLWKLLWHTIGNARGWWKEKRSLISRGFLTILYSSSIVAEIQRPQEDFGDAAHIQLLKAYCKN